MTDLVTVAVWNIEADGGRNGEHRDLALDVLSELEPDVFLQQEATFSRDRGSERLHAAEKRLALRGFLSAHNPYADADIATAVYLRPTMFDVVEARPRAKPWWLHPCHVVARLGSCPVPLHLLSFHMCCFDANQRLAEASWTAILAQPGMVTLAAGDTNSYPRNPELLALPNWAAVTDRAHMVHRTYLDADGHRRSDTRPDTALTDAGYLDLARYSADHLGQYEALNATAGQHKPDQGGPQRIDRAYGAGGLASALHSVEVVDNDDTREASDHALLILRFYRVRLERLLTPPLAAAHTAEALR
ncbi:endonuclease/exonuclease/phosphatase family protein [Streptomyces sp. NBC_00124]|uniref:endonuclease/exonuclease/phosphatase family protein n=1 Tax=Streptomyces sp. NBC_00124 TaxID=2975662 RepID=UPI00224D3DEF|nr:endonuclease/exonuclease/phosphatase family protein [Streptomyces sp. NBC_00124]MCX5357303.1 endonuclease/exonuclease/phosphatase family protein [Streptomyces sp. NBC_00124]